LSADELPDAELSSHIDIGASAWIFFGLLVLLISGFVAYRLLKTTPSPPPAQIAGDPLLVEGRELYLARCVSCHGSSGKGDGPIAHGLAGPPPGNLTDDQWKHGDQPGQVLKVLSAGVKDTAMPGFAGIFKPHELRALAAYVYHLANQQVPGELRTE
jgi:mono/diheme cytochrome c family protein